MALMGAERAPGVQELSACGRLSRQIESVQNQALSLSQRAASEMGVRKA